MSIYFDTNIIHHLRDGLKEQSLSEEDKRHVVLSPISVLELVSQIAVAPDHALNAIHALRSWVDIKHVELLGWTEVFVAHWVFKKEIADDVSEGLKRVLTTCYESETPNDKLRKDAAALLEFLKKSKRKKATLLENAARTLRQTPKDNSEDSLRKGARSAIAAGLRAQVGASDEITEDNIAGCLPAYFEFNTDLIVRAIPNVEFNFFSSEHLNDHFDAEQLVFLSDPSLHFFTADKGYCGVAKVEARVHILKAIEMQDDTKALKLMAAEIQKIEGHNGRA